MKNDTKGIYSSVRSQMGWTRNSPPQSSIIDGQRITAPAKLAETQLMFFKNKVEKLMATILRPTLDPYEILRKAIVRWNKQDGNRDILYLREVTASEIKKVIKSLGNSTAIGHDFIDAKAIKDAEEILAEPLAFLANLSMRNAKFADNWKVAKIIPLFKGKGTNRTSPGSYRPISILPTISKIIEKVVQVQILIFLESTNQLNHNHHVYRRHHNTATALLQISDSILEATDRNMLLTLVTIDESAAFDCVSTEILINKLLMYKMSKQTANWMESYMTDRKQYVEIATKKLSISTSSRGVPQGSILGLLMYTIYINKLPDILWEENCQEPAHQNVESQFPPNCKKCVSLPCYADDATVSIATKTRDISQVKIEKVMEKIKNYLNSQELIINISKTNLLESMVKQKRKKIKGEIPKLETVNDKREVKIIKPEKSMRLLGVNLEQNLTWNSHLENAEKSLLPSLRQQLGALRYTSKQIPRKSRLTLVNGLIMSRIHYAISLWSGTYANNVRKVQTIMNRTARWILNSSRRTKTEKLMDECKWLKVSELMEIQTIVMFWKLLKWKTPHQIYIKIRMEDDLKVSVDKPRLQTSQLGFLWRASILWNNLNEEIRKIENLQKLKKVLKKHYIDKRKMEIGQKAAEQVDDEVNNLNRLQMGRIFQRDVRNIQSVTQEEDDSERIEEDAMEDPEEEVIVVISQPEESELREEEQVEMNTEDTGDDEEVEQTEEQFEMNVTNEEEVITEESEIVAEIEDDEEVELSEEQIETNVTNEEEVITEESEVVAQTEDDEIKQLEEEIEEVVVKSKDKEEEMESEYDEYEQSGRSKVDEALIEEQIEVKRNGRKRKLESGNETLPTTGNKEKQIHLDKVNDEEEREECENILRRPAKVSKKGTKGKSKKADSI